ncbi:MAG TPA: hypothetical protein DCQ06_11185, partial [Myxococcales bacterium]|nr:hypothetical protein [Myxococcales bacterium]
FVRNLLGDVQALEMMLESDMIETGIRRIGAEQEMFLVDSGYRPAPTAIEVLKRINNPQFTTELARFNLEFNSIPHEWTGACLSTLEKEVRRLYRVAMKGAEQENCKVILTGILPTLSHSDLGLDNMTPMPRYFALNDALCKLRGNDFQTNIKGIDELNLSHDNVMLEACNTSFQVHFQVGPKEFAKLYNVAQAVTAPVMAAAVNSPVLLGNRLWAETRIALFQQSVDARSATHSARGMRPRVHFGGDWCKDGVVELFREDIARFRTLLSIAVEEDSIEQVKNKIAPQLNALRLHNGTVYRWNRPCYGVADGVAHLRIENRVIPSGPSIVDEMANSAFFLGLMSGMLSEHGPIEDLLDFSDAKSNFIGAARRGLNAEFHWLGGEVLTASRLIQERLLPLAEKGLRESGIDDADIDRYLGVLDERVSRGRTGSQWCLQSLAAMERDGGTRDERLGTVTKVTIDRQRRGRPVHSWKLASLSEAESWSESYQTVSQFMLTDLFTVRAEDIVDLAATLMEWERLRHVLVEDDDGNLVGLVSTAELLHLVSRKYSRDPLTSLTIGEIMVADVVTCTPETRTAEAISLMQTHRIGCLPVVRGNRLVGLVTDRQFVDVAGRLLDRRA